jgi:hypothetical protein
VGSGGTEQREDRVADVVLDRAALARDAGAHLRERFGEAAPHHLRANLHHHVRRAHHVDEQARDDPALAADIHSAGHCLARRKGIRPSRPSSAQVGPGVKMVSMHAERR